MEVVGAFLGGDEPAGGAHGQDLDERETGAGFLMAGYASLHKRARGKDWRLPVLILAYLSAVFVFPLLIILVLGLSDVRSTISLTPTRKTDNTNETNT